MQEQGLVGQSMLVAELNDLLQLDHDALSAYSLAISRVETDGLRETLREFRGDHERHIDELTRLIREHGGVPIELPHLPTGAFKLAVQAIGGMGGDREVLLAFKANERQVRDKYRRAASGDLPAGVREVVQRGAQDEARHYAWALEMLEEMGAGANTTVGRTERVVEVAHSRMADTIEGVERGAMAAAEAVRRGVTKHGAKGAIATVAAVVGVGILAAQLLGRARR